VYVNEKWCLGCHLCEYNCAFAESGLSDMVKALKGRAIRPRIRVEERGNVHYAVSCRHCGDPVCVKGCLTGALAVKDGAVTVDRKRCVGCLTCVALCPYGAISPSEDGPMQKCELCLETAAGTPACAAGCPNGAIVYEER